MAANLDELDSAFRENVIQLLQRCSDRGITLVANEGLRTPFKQAIYWRQSRSTAEIQEQLKRFRDAGADFLADCLESVGPQHGDEVTKTPPGLSWHQWALALDVFWLVDGKAEWSTKKKVNGLNGYHVYAEEAKALGLNPGLYWSGFVDPPHVQMPKESNPGKVYGLKEINDKMKELFGHL